MDGALNEFIGKVLASIGPGAPGSGE